MKLNATIITFYIIKVSIAEQINHGIWHHRKPGFTTLTLQALASLKVKVKIAINIIFHKLMHLEHLAQCLAYNKH